MLIVAQIGVHATMAGVCMAAPLQSLREGHSAWSVGVLPALYAAAPVLLSLPAGRCSTCRHCQVIASNCVTSEVQRLLVTEPRRSASRLP